MEYNCIEPIMGLLRNEDDGLQQFEGLLALTNIASMGGDVAEAIAEKKRLAIIESLHHDNFPPLRRYLLLSHLECFSFC